MPTLIEQGFSTYVAYGLESTFATPPAAGSSKFIRRVSGTPSWARPEFLSNELTQDREVHGSRLGLGKVQGDIAGELSVTSWTDWFQMLMGGTWAAGATTSGSIGVVAGPPSQLVLSSGTWQALGFRVGDVVAATALGVTADDNVDLRIMALSGANMTVDQLLTVDAPAAGVTVAATGNKISIGTTRRSMSLETQGSTIGEYQLVSGVRIGKASLSMQPNGNATVTWSLMGTVAQPVSTTPYFTAPAAAPTSQPLTASGGGFLGVGGTTLSTVTGLTLTIDNTMSVPDVILAPYAPDVLWGRTNLTGELTCLWDSASTVLINDFMNEVDNFASFVLYEPDSAPQNFLNFCMNRVKFTSYTIEAQGEQGALIRLPFRTYKPDPTLTSNAVLGTSSLTIQSST